jgi:hypothetical protein
VKLVFSGAEVGSNRTLLENMSIEVMGMSFYALKKRGLPKTKLWLVSEHFPSHVQVILDSGIRQAEADGLSKEELISLAAEYQEFVANNVERITAFIEPDSRVMGLDWVLTERGSYEHDPKFYQHHYQ